MRIISLMISGSVIAAGFMSARANPALAKNCKLSDIVSNYKSGLQHFNAKNYDYALLRWVPLTETGLGPAQRQIAAMYATDLGLEKSPAKAALWAELSFRSGDPCRAVSFRRLAYPTDSRVAAIAQNSVDGVARA